MGRLGENLARVIGKLIFKCGVRVKVAAIPDSRYMPKNL